MFVEHRLQSLSQKSELLILDQELIFEGHGLTAVFLRQMSSIQKNESLMTVELLVKVLCLVVHVILGAPGRIRTGDLQNAYVCCSTH